VEKSIDKAESNFRRGLSDDLNISVSLTAVFNLIKEANILISQEKIKKKDAEKLSRFVDSVDTVLGGVIAPTLKIRVATGIHVDGAAKAEVPLPDQKVGARVEITDEQQEKIRQREKARAEKNFAEADKIRADLAAEGILIEDAKDGSSRVKKVPVPPKPA
jgi:cysteinyl-tRNA synthetase